MIPLVCSRAVLLVEDDPGIGLLVRRVLGRISIEVLLASTASKAEEILRHQLPAALLLDLNLPDRSGADFVRSVLPQFPSLPFIVLTGEVDDRSSRLAIELGAVGLIFKNQDFVTEIRETVEAILGDQCRLREPLRMMSQATRSPISPESR